MCRGAVSESSLREQEPKLAPREEKTPRARLELPPARSMTLSGPKPKIRSALGGLRSKSGARSAQSLLEIGTSVVNRTEVAADIGEVSVVEGKCIPAVLPAVRVTVRESFLESI